MESTSVTDRVPENTFYGIIWMGVALCTAAFGLRIYVRIACFHRLLPEDYVMMISLIILIAFSIMAQIQLSNVYFFNHVLRGAIQITLENLQEVLDRASAGLKTEGACLILFIIGIALIKINFLVFFYRIGSRLRTFVVLWWVSFGIALGCGFTGLGIIPYRCLFEPALEIIQTCSTTTFAKYEADVNKASVAIDVVSDAVVIAFPISILFNANLGLRQKLTLSGVFCLVGVTVAMTIVRGLTFNDIDTTWAMFFFYVEYIVAFIIACIISFRSLWRQRNRRGKERDIRRQRSPPQPGQPAGIVRRLKHWHDITLATFEDLEGTTLEQNEVELLQDPRPESSGQDQRHLHGEGQQELDVPESNLWDSQGRTPTGRRLPIPMPMPMPTNKQAQTQPWEADGARSQTSASTVPIETPDRTATVSQVSKITPMSPHQRGVSPAQTIEDQSRRAEEGPEGTDHDLERNLGANSNSNVRRDSSTRTYMWLGFR